MKPLTTALRNTKGAIDLASIMVGIIVIGIVGGVIAATVFKVIPWAQDNAAKASLGAVATAESAQAGMNEGKYATYEQLTAKNLIVDSPKLGVTIAVDGSCYLAVSVSDTGNVYYGTDKGGDVQLYTAGTSTTTCGDLDALVETVLDGSGNGSEATCGTGTAVAAAALTHTNAPALPASHATATGNQAQLTVNSVNSFYIQGNGNPGSRLAVNVSVTNNSGGALSNVTAQLSSGESVNLGNIASGATNSGMVQHVVTQADADLGAVRGRVAVTSGSLSTTSASYNQTTAAQASVVTGSFVSNDIATASCGEVITSTFTFVNQGNVTAYGVSFDSNAVVSSYNLSADTLAPSQDVVVTVQHVVTQADVEAGTFASTITLTAVTAQGDEVNFSASAQAVTLQ